MSTMNQSVLILPVSKGTELAAELLDFVRNFSWDEVKEHTAAVIGEWRFAGWERPFAAVCGGRVVGMATLMKSDYYPLPDVFPWVSTIFVDEAFRGRGICGMLIDAANEYARSLGFEKTYIPTGLSGLYERYGYTYVRDIVNYGGDTDRLYVKEIG